MEWPPLTRLAAFRAGGGGRRVSRWRALPNRATPGWKN